jgi:hypothetical protein
MKSIPLTQNKVAWVDDDVYERVSKFKWHFLRVGYAARSVYKENGRRAILLLHREILGLPPGDKRRVDHINGDKLLDVLRNLRICSHAENLRAFRQPRENTTSKFRGVSWDNPRCKWYVQIKHNYKNIRIGRFTHEETAARAYDEKARELGWPEQGLNFPTCSPI